MGRVMVVRLIVVGRPVPKGSLNPRVSSKGNVQLFWPQRVREWERQIKGEAEKVMTEGSFPLIEARCSVKADFFLNPGSDGHIKGDIDKLVRGLLDALTGVVYADDGLVTTIFASKQPPRKGELERVEATVAIRT